MAITLIPQRKSLLAAALVLLIGGWLVAFGLTLWHLREKALADGLAAARLHARNFEEQVTQALLVIDISASNVNNGRERAENKADINRRLSSLLYSAPFVRSVSLLDSNDVVTASSHTGNIGVQIALDDFYPPAVREATMLRIGPPRHGRDLDDAKVGTGGPAADNTSVFIPIVRQHRTDGQVFAWIAALNPDYFVNHATHLLQPEEGRLQILRYDDRLLLSSDPRDTPGASMLAGQVATRLSQAEFGEFAQTLPDGMETLTAYRASSLYPIAIAVHLDRHHILSKWQAEARWLSMIFVPVIIGLTIALILVWQRQVRIETQRAEMEKQRRLAASVFEASSDAIMMTRPDGDVLAVNTAFQRITGYSASEVIGKNPRLLSSGHHTRDFYRAMWESIAAQGYWQGEIVNRRKDGSPYHGLLAINAVCDEEGQVQHYVSVTSDISERKRYEAELLVAKERAEAADLAKTIFLATMSHELRTPMNGVLGMTEVLLRSDLNDKQRRQLNIIRASAESLLAILNDILDYSQIESHGLTVHAIDFDPAWTIRSVIGLFSPRAEAKSLSIGESISETMPSSIVCDPVRFRQILTNLLSNAVKFTRQGGITVSAWITGLADPGGKCCLGVSVSDTGIGIPPDKLEAVFDPFFQVDGSASRNYGGSGLGLAICRRLVEALGGQMQVESTPGQGSCFTVRLPIRVGATPVRDNGLSRQTEFEACP